MSQLKKCKIVMLPTEKAENSLLLCNNKELRYVKGYFTQEYLKSENRKSYHLYIISDDEIKEGDWCIKETSMFTEKFIIQAKGYGDINSTTALWRKIIATTDNSLFVTQQNDHLGQAIIQLPQPSESFIQKYVEEHNKGNVITDVMVEYQAYRKDGCPFYLQPNGLLQAHDEHGWETLDVKDAEFKLKVDKNNTITIKKIKDSWNKEELQVFKNSLNNNHLEFIYERMIHVHKENPNYDYMLKFKEIVKWIENNL